MNSARSSIYRSSLASSGNDASVQRPKYVWASKISATKAARRSTKERADILELEVDEGDVIDGGIGHDDQSRDGVGGPPDHERLLEQYVAERPILSDRLTQRDGEPGDERAGHSFLPADPVSGIRGPAGERHVRENEHRIGKGTRPENGQREREEAEGDGGPERVMGERALAERGVARQPQGFDEDRPHALGGDGCREIQTV